MRHTIQITTADGTSRTLMLENCRTFEVKDLDLDVWSDNHDKIASFQFLSSETAQRAYELLNAEVENYWEARTPVLFDDEVGPAI